MPNLIEHLKEAENSIKKGLKDDGWYPHKSVEGGTRTLAYGHKLSQAEEAGNFVTLPDGTIHDFDTDGGLSESQAMQLMLEDVRKHKYIAQKQWDKYNKKTPFSSLSPKYQDVLTEIAYNIGGLMNSNGKFGWPALADGIKAGDDEVVKKESERTANGKKLSTRNKQVKDFIDDYQPMQQPVVEGDIETGLKESIRAQLAARGEVVDADLQPISNDSQRAPQGLTAEEEAELAELEAWSLSVGLGGDQATWTEEDEEELRMLEEYDQPVDTFDAEITTRALPEDRDAEIHSALQRKLDEAIAARGGL